MKFDGSVPGNRIGIRLVVRNDIGMLIEVSRNVIFVLVSEVKIRVLRVRDKAADMIHSKYILVQKNVQGILTLFVR